MKIKPEKLAHEFGVIGVDGSKFLRGRFEFYPSTKHLRIGSNNPVDIDIPPAISFKEGPTHFRLCDNDGKPKKQVRIVDFKIRDGILYAPGSPKTPARFTPDQGYNTFAYKFRAYQTIAGVGGSRKFPEWLEKWIASDRQSWNAPAVACRNARRDCFAGIQDELQSFRKELLERIYRFNASIGMSKDKLPDPKEINKKFLVISPFARYAAWLRRLLAEDHPVPMDLLDDLDAFVLKMRPLIVWTPINGFQRNVAGNFDAATADLDLHPVQRKTARELFERVLKARRQKKDPNFDHGWPVIRYDEDNVENNKNFKIQVHVNSCDTEVGKVFSSVGVGGLRLGAAIPLADTGHSAMEGGSRAGRRTLHQATITLPKTGETYTFYVLLTRGISKEFLKQWSLIKKGDEMWLCLSVVAKFPAVTVDVDTSPASLELGWRTMPDGDGDIRVGTFLLPEPSNSPQEIFVNFEESYGKNSSNGNMPVLEPGESLPKTTQNLIYNSRDPRRARLGAGWRTRGVMRRGSSDKGKVTTGEIDSFVSMLNLGVTSDKQLSQNYESVSKFIKLSRSYIFVDTFSGIVEMQSRRSLLLEMMKAYLKPALGPLAPPWLSQAQSHGIRKLLNDSAIDHAIISLIKDWLEVDKTFGIEYASVWKRVVARRRNEYERIVNALMKQCVDAGVRQLNISELFLNSTIKSITKYSHPALQNSQRIRQWVGLSSFVQILKMIARKYGISVQEISQKRKTKTCYSCGAVNEVGANKNFVCIGCGKEHDQDYNASKNLRDEKHVMVAGV